MSKKLEVRGEQEKESQMKHDTKSARGRVPSPGAWDEAFAQVRP